MIEPRICVGGFIVPACLWLPVAVDVQLWADLEGSWTLGVEFHIPYVRVAVAAVRAYQFGVGGSCGLYTNWGDRPWD